MILQTLYSIRSERALCGHLGYLVNSSGTTLASSLGSTATESLTYTNGAAKTVYIRVIAYSGSSTTLTYTVKLKYQLTLTGEPPKGT